MKQTQKEFDAAVQKKRNDSVLKVSLNYLDNNNILYGIRAVQECYSSWESTDKQEIEAMDKEISTLLNFLIELGKPDIKMVDMACNRLKELIKGKKEQRKQSFNH